MKFWEVFVVILVSVLTIIQETMLAPILPLQMKRRHISQTAIGIVVGSYSAGVMAGSIIPTDHLYSYLGRRKAAQGSLIMLALSLFLYALAYYIPDHQQAFFFISNLMTRIFEGIATGLFLKALLSLIILNFPENTGRAISARSCGLYFGLSLGGVIGGTFYSYLGYFGVFFTFSILTLLTTPLLFIFKEIEEKAKTGANSSPLTFCQYLRIRRSMLTQICHQMSNATIFTLYPTLALHLKSEFDYSALTTGFYLFLYFLGGAVTMTSALFFPESWDRRKFIAPGMFLTPVFSFLIGPSQIFHLPDSPKLIALGIILVGAARGICSTLSPAEALTGGLKIYPSQKAKLSDFVSSMTMFMMGFSTLVFPIIGSAFVQHFGFRLALDLVSIILVLNSSIYLVSTIKDWREERKQDQRQQLKRDEEQTLLHHREIQI